MGKHDVIVLEEPPASDFKHMLNGSVGVTDYLMSQDIEYPEFSRRMCHLEKQLHDAGKLLIQVEPFFQALLSIHEFFARGNDPGAIKPNTLQHFVFKAEQHATGKLLDFYKTAASGPFEAVVEAVRQFAKADAARFRLRDSLRAQEISRQAGQYSSIYVEAGVIHYFLFKELHRLMADSYRVQPIFLNRLVLKNSEVNHHLYSPGDQLTLFYIFHPKKVNTEREKLLAARSIIYSKSIHKEENIENAKTFFHLEDEINCIRLVKKLSINDCQRLYIQIKHLHTAEARQIVKTYAESEIDDG